MHGLASLRRQCDTAQQAGSMPIARRVVYGSEDGEVPRSLVMHAAVRCQAVCSWLQCAVELPQLE